MFVLQIIENYSIAIGLFVCFAPFIWILAATFFRSITQNRTQRRGRTCHEEEEDYIERERRRLRREKYKATLSKYQEVVKNIADLNSHCRASWDQVTRAAAALHGSSRTGPFAGAVMHDALQILSAFSDANGHATKDLGRLYQAISRGCDSGGRTLKECISAIEDFERGEICLPATIQILQTSDRLFSNGLASRAAAAYSSLVIEAAGCCDASFAIATVRTAYNDLFEPYLAECKGDRADSQPDNNSRKASSGTGNVSCPVCAEAYQLLELPLAAGPDAVSSARKEMAKSFHPDAFGNKRGARIAEQQLQRINEACDHLLTCNR
jgi:hypothetical protein